MTFKDEDQLSQYGVTQATGIGKKAKNENPPQIFGGICPLKI